MKLVATKHHLRDIFQKAERFTGKNLSLPILGNVFFEATSQSARCIATNLEMGVEMSIPCKVVKNGSVVIPGKFAASIMHSVDDDTVTVEHRNGTVYFSTESANFSLHSILGGDFPSMPKIKHEYSFSISVSDLSRALSQILPSVSSSDLRPELSGVFFKKDARSLTMAATDSFRLSERVCMFSSPAEGAGSFIVPGRACQEVLRSLTDGEGEIHISSGESHVAFEVPGTRVVSRLVDGTYPDYAAIIPKDFSTHIVAPREELVRKVKAASIMSSKLNDLSFSFVSGERSSIETTNAEVGKSQITFPAKVKGKGGRISFNFRYLLDGLEALSGEEVSISMNSDSSPVLLRDNEDTAFQYVVMPIRNV